MSIYTCTCEDEFYKNTCSQECDSCGFGHTEEDVCVCHDCMSRIEEEEAETAKPKNFVQIIDIHENSIYLLKEAYEKDPYDFIDGTTIAIRTLKAQVCPNCKVQPAHEEVFPCDKCLNSEED